MNPQTRLLCEVSINETTGVERSNHPIFTGIPFPQGALQPQDAGWLTLALPDHSARLLGTPAAFWPDGSIKWLHLSGLVNLSPSQQTTAQLLLTNTPAGPTITAQASPTHAHITTSLLDLHVDLTAPAPLLKIALNHASPSQPPAYSDLLTGPGLTASITLTPPSSTSSTSSSSTQDPGRGTQDATSPPPTQDTGHRTHDAALWQPDSLSIASQTDNRIILRMTGFFTQDGRQVAEMILFLEILQDTPEIRLQPVLIYLGDPDKDAIADFSLTLHTALAHPDAPFALAQQRGIGHWDIPQPVGPNDDRALAQAATPQKPENYTPNAGGPRFPEARILQTGSSFYKLEKRTTPQNSWVKIAEGQRNPGWVHLSSPAHAVRGISGITAAMRYFWQEYPRSLSLNSDTGQITFGLVPPDTEPLSFKRYSDFKWGAAMYETGRGPFPAQTHGATGIAKASELLLRFEPPSTSPSSTQDTGRRTQDASLSPAQTGLLWANPPTLLPSPHHVAASGVFGTIAAAPAKGFESLEAQLAKLLDFIINERDYRNWYGLLNFGDMLMSYYADKDQWAFDDGGYAWINCEALPDHAIWMSALRSGRHDWLRAAIEMSRHNRDIDIYHRGNFKGTGSRHNVNHWGDADKEWRISMPITQRLHYYLTGDPWTREVMFDTIAVYQSYERTSRLAPSMSSALLGLMVKHELTGDAADGKAAQNLLDLYASAVGPDGHYANQLTVDIATGKGHIHPDGKNLVGSYFFLLNFGAQHTLVMGQEAYNHEELQKSFQRYCDMCLSYVRPSHVEAYMAPQSYASTVFLSSVYSATADEKYADALRKHLHINDELVLQEIGGDGPLDTPRHLALINCKRRNKVVCHIGEIMNLFPYAFKALEK